MKLGLSIRLDVTKIEKARLFKGQKGTYLDLTTFVDVNEKDQYDNNGFISQSVSKEEREQGVKTPILGNVKVFYGAEQHGYQQAPQQPPSQPQSNGFQDDSLDDIPF